MRALRKQPTPAKERTHQAHSTYIAGLGAGQVFRLLQMTGIAKLGQ